MKSIKRIAKRTLSFALCLTMLLTTMFFFDIGITETEAAVASASTDMDDVLFYVPEAVYLRPVSSSWGASTKSKFHYFVENTVLSGGTLLSSPTPNTTAETTGHVYFKYAHGTLQDLTIRWLDQSLSTTYSDGGALMLTNSGGDPTAAGGVWATVSRDMESPTLAAGTTGCVIEWTLTYHDNADNLDKAIVAYTYVYKPYVVPIAGGLYVENDRGTMHTNAQITWISGFHYMDTVTTHNDGVHEVKYSRYTTTAAGSTGMLPFMTNDAQAINGNSDGAEGSTLGYGMGNMDEKSTNAAEKVLYFASTNTSYAYFRANQANSGINNMDSNAWHSNGLSASTTVSTSSTFNIGQHAYSSQTSDAGTDGDRGRLCSFESNGLGGMYIDTSRYTNLAQIPNLGVGLLVTNDESSDDGAWYVADYTGRTNSYPLQTTSKGSYYTTDMMNCWNDYTSIIVREGTMSSRVSGCELDGVKYAGAWDRAISSPTGASSTVTYKIKGAYYNQGSKDSILAGIILGMKVQQYNKANLRTAVNNAIKEFAHFGIYDTNFNSRYYNNTGAYSAFVSAYKAAYAALIAVDMAPVTAPNTLATNLNNAVSALKSDTAARKTGTAYQYNVGLLRNADDTYRIVKIPGATQYTKTYYLRDKVDFTVDSYTGYTYKGMLKMVSNLSIDALTKEEFSLSALPTFTSSSNKVNYTVTQNSSTKTTTFGATSTVSTSTSVATISGSTVTYPYAYDTDISYIYFYEITDGEVLFGNEFDFDNYRWTNTGSTGTQVVDHVNNTLSITAPSGSGEAYTGQLGTIPLIGGHTYQLSYDFAVSAGTAQGQYHLWFTANAGDALETDGNDKTKYIGGGKTASTAAGGSSSLAETFTVPEGRTYVTIRFDTDNANTAAAATGTFSNIYIYDITDFAGNENASTIPSPIYKSSAAGTSVSGFPTISRSGYTFAGWSTARDSKGNGTAAGLVTSTTVPAGGNRTLYPVWQTNVTYVLDGGMYRKSSDSLATSYQVENRTDVEPTTSVAVSNRVVQGQTDWNSTDVNNTYVPYKPGYNFKGWLASSTDASVNGNVYWPMDSVVTNANVEFTAQWEEAPTVTLNTTSRISSSNNDGERAFYPGQVHFYKYTPETNQYASAYTYYSGGDLEMQAFDGSLNFISENDNYEYNYGIDGIAETDPMITMSLTSGETYYAGITMHSITGTTADGTNFRIQEHTVKYTLLPNGGTINGSQETQSVTGYSNIETVLPSTGEMYGYNFAGWKSNEVPAVEYAAGENIPGVDNYNRLNGYTTSLVREIILTAQWTPKPFGVIYDQNIPEGATPTQAAPMPSTGTFRYDNEGTVSEVVPSMDGYTFKGWATTAEKADGEKLYQKSEVIAASVINGFFDANNGGSVTLYARWAPNLIIVRFKPGTGTGTEFTQNFYYDQEQAIATQNFDPEKYSVGFYEVGTTEAIATLTADLEFDGWADVETGTPNFTYANGAVIKNPNGITGTSDTVGTETILYAKWKGGSSTVTAPVWVKTEETHVLAGWSLNSDASTIDYAVGEVFAPKGDMKLYAVWYPVANAEANIEDFKQYDTNEPIVSGIEFVSKDLTAYNEIKDLSVPVYDTVAYKAAVQRYETARENLKKNPTAANNQEYYDSIKAVESMEKPVTKDPVITYLTEFEIKYAEGVTGAVPAGKYSLADMNLNHYATTDLDAASEAKTEADEVENMLNQSIINRSVVTMAKTFANKQDVKESTPTYNVYETAEAIKASGLIESEDITAMNYVYTGKGNYTYYCYTNSMTPTMLLTVDEVTDTDNRMCYPTTATFDTVTMTKGAISDNPKFTSVTDAAAADNYSTYLAAGLGTKNGADYYTKKAVVELNPDFTNAQDKATVAYVLQAHDDAYAATQADVNYADTAKLASGTAKSTLSDIPETAVTPANTITIIIDYHNPGDSFTVTSDQVGEDDWLKQYHLFRTSGGASNWELPMPGDSVYVVNDATYGQKDYGSFTYTFNVGASNDFANGTLTSSDVETVKTIIAENYDAVKAATFTGTNKGGNGLGYLKWSNTTWSFNYYPASNSYTYVHLVDRWGNVVDKVIEVPNIDAIATSLNTQNAGATEIIEDGGSGIDTMSFNTSSIEIIADENSIFDGSTYTTTGNTVTVYTGEANKTYSLTVNDVATNATTANVTTDGNGYLTLTVEDKAFDTASGAYSFTLNDMSINLYADVEKKVLSAEDVEVTAGETAVIEVVTTADVTMVQLVSETGSTTTATTYTEDENGNRVWQIEKTRNEGEYEYTVRVKVDGKWTTEGDTVTLTVKAVEIFVGAVTMVEYTPSESTRNEFMFTVTGRPEKIQVIEPDGGTRTYDRYHAKVVIVSYNAEGEVISSMSRELSYEVWTIEMNVPAQKELTAIARYGRQWSKEAPYKYTVVLATPEYDDEVYSMALDATEGWQGKVGATVVTGMDVSGVQFVMDNNTTATYYTSTEADNKLTYTGTVWINHSGDNIIIVKIRVNNAWLNAGELSYYAI